MTTVTRPKWHPQPPQTPRILHLPRRTSRRKVPNKIHTTKPNSETNPFLRRPQNVKLENLFDQESAFSYTIPPVVLLNSCERGKNDNVPENEEGRWRFQAEMLRAECNFLRMEREIAVMKLERERVVLEKSLKSTVHTLHFGKKKIHDGESAKLVLEEEIQELAKKLVELQMSSKLKPPVVHNCIHFDKQSRLLRKKLEKYSEMQDENPVKEMTEVSVASFTCNYARDGSRIKCHGSSRRSTRFTDVETLKKMMEVLSKGKLLKRMEEEYGYMLSSTANYSAPCSASTSKRFDLSESSSFSVQQCSQEEKSRELKPCSGLCKAIVRRILKQVKAETEQWSQMQEMLGHVRAEMEKLQNSRDFWAEQALESEHRVQALQADVEVWKKKAQSLETKENQLNKQVQELQQELEKISKHEVKPSKDTATLSLGAQLARAKQMLMYNSENKEIDCNDGKKAAHENRSEGSLSNRKPFKEISNISHLARQNSRRYVYPLHKNPNNY